MEENKALDVMKKVVKYTTPLGFMAFTAAELASQKSKAIIESGDIDEMALEAKRKRLELEILEGDAKIAQELAIAQRIEHAEEVTIEEYYDASGDGSLGVSLQGEVPIIGAKGSGRQVSKRVYTFRGFNDSIVYAQGTEKISTDETNQGG